MRTGTLRHWITLQSLLTTQDETGAPSTEWADVASMWADVRFLNGLETVRADAPIAVAKASIRIHYRAGVAANMRVLHDGLVFDIKSPPLPDSTGRLYLDLACEQGANLG